ncbi:hypothetical protein [Paraburkholderia humisilvae]|uniref:Uncharacterized protein n=1 Tax=Paraburkholderia humisilvae TaxID=627669 RepID=A0A6J5F9E8_9BURK|nr:hypothetical protein [Paraburkholderia humisilvae]CAB3774252.1 hypothetical protein LMG29542_07668 [Paraburkholderia humisilvae]
MLKEFIHGKESGYGAELASLLTDRPFASPAHHSNLETFQRNTYEQPPVLNRCAGSRAELIANRKHLFTAVASSATVNPSLFHVAQSYYGVALSIIKTLTRGFERAHKAGSVVTIDTFLYLFSPFISPLRS